MANTLKIKRSSTNPIGSVGTVAFGELVITDVSNVLKFYATDSANSATLLIEQPNGDGAQFWAGDGTWKTPVGSGNVNNTGTPVDNQIAVWTDATTIQGDVALTFDTLTDTLGVGTTNDGTINVGETAVINNNAGTVELSNVGSIDATTGTAIDTQIGSNYATSAQGTLADSAVQPGDTDASALGWVDNGTVGTGSTTKVPTQAAVKSYVDAVAASEMTYQGSYDATVNPNSAASVGDVYTVTVAGSGAAGAFWTTPLAIGDMIIAETNNPATEADWTTVEQNLDGVVFEARTLTAGTGISGGGDLSTDRTFNLDINSLTVESAIDGATDYLACYSDADKKVLVNDILDLGTF